MKVLQLGLTLVRHGETQYNKEGLLQGQTIDSGLSEIGLQQAEAAGRYLKDVLFTNVFASDMLRAQQTAEAIMRHNSSCSGLRMVCDPLLKERSFGIAEGRHIKDVREMAKAVGQTFPDFTPPEGETQDQVRERVESFLDKTLRLIWDERGRDGGEELRPGRAPAEAPPHPPHHEGTAEDGVRGAPAHALVVTHGAYMCAAVRYFVEELRCPLAPGCDKAAMLSLSPNAGLCRFMLTLGKEEDGVRLSHIRCLFMHRKDHIGSI